MIYGEAYSKCDSSPWDEDLLCRFLNGPTDQKAQQQIKFVKDPGNIDEALDEVLKYRHATQGTWQRRAPGDALLGLPTRPLEGLGPW